MILITLPHGKVNAGDGYDAGALEFLPILEAALRVRAMEVEVVVGDTNREMIDLNRLEGKSTEFMDEVRNKLKETTIHLDIHSFPYVEEGELDEDSYTETGYDLRQWSVNDVVLFNIPEVTDQDLLNLIDENLQLNGIDVGIEGPGFENYITITANVLFDVPSLLVELNENSAQVLPVVAAQVAESLQAYVGTSSDPLEVTEAPN